MSGMSDDDDFFLDSDGDEEPMAKKNKSAAETPVPDEVQQSRLNKPKPTPVYRSEVIDPTVPVCQTPIIREEEEDLSQLLKQPEFYEKLANAVHNYPALYDCGHPRFRTNQKNKIKLWTKVGKAVHFRGTWQDLEAEWKALGVNYRHWYLERAQKKISTFDDDIEDVFLSMKWAQEKLIPWFERSPLFVALLHVKERHETKGVWPLKRRRVEVSEAEKTVYDVPEREPVESTAKKRQSLVSSTGETPRSEAPKCSRPRMEFPEGTPERFFAPPVISRLRNTTPRERYESYSRHTYSAVHNLSRDSLSPETVISGPDMDLYERVSSPGM